MIDKEKFMKMIDQRLDQRTEQINRFSKLAEPVLEWLDAGAPHTNKDLGFNMDFVHQSKDAFTSQPFDFEETPCNTACCIAGALWEFNEFPKKDAWVADHKFYKMFPELESELHGLFYPKTVSGSYQGIKPEEAADAIRMFIYTKGAMSW